MIAWADDILLPPRHPSVSLWRPSPDDYAPPSAPDTLNHMYDAIAAVIASRREQCAEVAGTLAGKRRIYVVGIGTLVARRAGGGADYGRWAGVFRVQLL